MRTLPSTDSDGICLWIIQELILTVLSHDHFQRIFCLFFLCTLHWSITCYIRRLWMLRSHIPQALSYLISFRSEKCEVAHIAIAPAKSTGWLL